MFNINLASMMKDMAPVVIGENWKKFIGQTEREAAVFEYGISCNNYKEKKGFRKQLIILITNRNEVFWGLFEFTDHLTDLESLEFIGDHSSCWGDSLNSKLNEIYFQMCQYIDPNKAPAEVYYHLSHNLGSLPFRKIEINVDTDRQNPYRGYGYNKTLRRIT